MKKTFNELHQWLLQNWTAARQLEDSMNEVQDRYKTVCERVVEAVQEQKPELNNCQRHFKREGFHIAFARREWPSQNERWPSGLWISNISLDNLMSEEGDPLYASIWLSIPKGIQVDLEKARTRIQNAAAELLKGEKLKCFFKDEPETCLWYTSPESRQALAQMLLDDESEKFVECIVSHVMILARFIPVLDEILLKNRP
jgi:hypothetical protein